MLSREPARAAADLFLERPVVSRTSGPPSTVMTSQETMAIRPPREADRLSLRAEASRKAIHMASALVPALVWLMPRGASIALLGAAVCIALATELARRYLRPFRLAFLRRTRRMLRGGERHGLSGATWMALAYLVAVLIFPLPVAVVAMLYNALAWFPSDYNWQEAQKAIRALKTTPAPYTCKSCGAPSHVDPSDQSPPPDYCHPEDHGEPASAVSRDEIVAVLEEATDAVDQLERSVRFLTPENVRPDTSNARALVERARALRSRLKGEDR